MRMFLHFCERLKIASSKPLRPEAVVAQRRTLVDFIFLPYKIRLVVIPLLFKGVVFWLGGIEL